MSLKKSLFMRPLVAVSGLLMAASIVLAPLAYAQSSGGDQSSNNDPSFGGNQSSGGQPRDCDNNAILHCGAYSIQEMQEKYNSQDGAKAVFNVFGIDGNHMNQMQGKAVNGHVTKGGRVLVNGETVADGAVTVGRQNMAGSDPFKLGNSTYYMRPPSASFNQDKLDAYVVMSGDRFQYAIIKSCGNPVRATPVQKPKPAPQQPAAQPSSAECRNINLTTGQNRQVSVTVNSSATNAQITGYTIDFGDGTPPVNVNAGGGATQDQSNATNASSSNSVSSSGSDSASGNNNNSSTSDETPNRSNPADGASNNLPGADNRDRPTGTSGSNASNVSSTSNSDSSNTSRTVQNTSTNQPVSGTSPPVTYQYNRDGNFTITASVQVRHPDGRTETKTSETCKIPVTFAPPAAPAAKVEPPAPPPPPAQPLPAAGAGDVIGVAAAVGTASTFGYLFYGWLRSRLYSL